MSCAGLVRTAALVACCLGASCAQRITSVGQQPPAAGSGAGGTAGNAGSGPPPRGGSIGFDQDALGSSLPPDGSAGGGGPPASCAAEMRKAQQAPLDLLLLLDTSGSMNESTGTQSKWQLARTALQMFWQDPRSAGLGMGLQFFPLNGGDRTCATSDECTGAGVSAGTCEIKHACAGATLTLPAPGCTPAGFGCAGGTTCKPVGRCALSGGDCLAPGMPCPTGAPGDTCMARGKICNNIGSGSCTAADYQALTVPIAALPAGLPPLRGAVTLKEPIGFTPTTPAVAGALDHLAQHLAANPTHKAVLVLITDGLPTGCTGNDTAAVSAALAAARARTPSVATYAIGVFGSTQLGGRATLDQWAAAGGTGTATVLTPTADFASSLLAALNTIRGAALSCEFTIPAATTGKIDYDKLNVRLSGAAGASDVLYVGAADRCNATTGGWYYDVDPRMSTPARVLVCPATCGLFNGDPTAQLDLVFGCATRVIQ